MSSQYNSSKTTDKYAIALDTLLWIHKDASSKPPEQLTGLSKQWLEKVTTSLKHIQKLAKSADIGSGTRPH
jgi:hypothetical protein